MSEPYLPKFNWLRFLLLGSAVGVTAFVAVFIIGVVVINISNYQDSQGLPNVDTPSAQVSIGNLPNGFQLKAGESLLINTTAIGPQAFLSMELWVDGVLGGVQAAPSGGVHPFSTYFRWLPKEPGKHSLIAAAIDTEGEKTMSAQVVVIVTPVDVEGVVPPQDPGSAPDVLPAPSAGGYIQPIPPGADSPVSPAENWNGTPGDWVNSITTDEIPTAPELVASPKGCTTELLIHDLSDNEEGFLVYKEDSYSPNWVQVVALNGNSQSDWISFTDGGLPGTVSYYVSAFNSQGEADSNLASVEIDPADCPQVLNTLPGYTLEINKLFPEVEAEKSYCYLTTDGVIWSRWPASGFFPMHDEGYVVGGPVINVLDPEFQGKDITPRSGVDMECWGWNGGVLVKLGNIFAKESFPTFVGSQLVPGNGISVEVEIKPIEFVADPSFPVSISGSDFAPGGGSHGHLETSINPKIPHVWLHQTADPEVCKQYLPSHAQNAQGQASYCFAYPKFDPNQGTGVVQPYLYWDFGESPTCLAGGGENCLDYPQLLDLAEKTGGMVGFEVSSISNAGKFTWSVTEPNLRSFVVPPLNCTGSSDYRVRLWYKPGPKGAGLYAVGEMTGPAVELDKSDISVDEKTAAEVEEPTLSEQDQPVVEQDSPYSIGEGGPQAVVHEVFYGMPSNLQTIPCVPIVAVGSVMEPTQYLDITFQSVEFFEIDDGDVYIDNPQDVELYGYFRVKAPSMGQLQEDPCVFDLFCDEDDEEPYYAYTRRAINIADWEGHDGKQYCQGCTVRVTSGYYDLSDWAMCQSTNKYSCIYEGQDSKYYTNNNTVRVFVQDGDALDIEIRLVDYDDASGDDDVCRTGKFLEARSLTEWANVQNEPLTFSSNMDTSGRCKVEAVINAVNP